MNVTCEVCGLTTGDTNLRFNRKSLTLHCPACGLIIEDIRATQEAEMIRFGSENVQHRQTFEIAESSDDMLNDQYFVMWGHAEGDAFNPERITGLWGAKDAAEVLNHYRQTGVVKVPDAVWRPHRGKTWTYHNAEWCYVLKAEAILCKLHGGDEIRRTVYQ